MSTDTLTTLFGQKSWANDQLFALLATVPAAQADVLHGCIRRLNHIYVVDRLFRAHLSGEPRPFDATNTAETPTLDALRRDVAETDAWYVAHVTGLAPQALGESIAFDFTDGDRGCMTREEILLHVITHGGYHRGNVGELLRTAGVAPPRDLYTKYLHELQPQRRDR